MLVARIRTLAVLALVIFVPAGTEANELETISELELKPDEVWSTRAQRLYIENLKAEEGSRIRIEGGAHDTTPSAPGARGRDGGPVRIFVRHLDGRIVIESSGADGGAGRSGQPGASGLPGANGKNARSLFFGLFPIENGYDGKSGGAGSPGEPGEAGGDGGRGGDVLVFYEQATEDSQILIDVAGGAGGLGGLGGWGGLGGPGGRGGKGIQRGKPGRAGASGLPGLAGASGRPGEPGSARLYQVSEPLFECLIQLEVRAEFEDLEDADFQECANLPSDPPKIQTAREVHIDEKKTWWIQANGAPGSRGLIDGQSGVDGARGGIVELVFSEFPQAAVVTAIGGAGGAGARGRPGTPGRDGRDGENAGLTRDASVGEDGGDGARGGAGGAGGSGGKGGLVELVYVSEEAPPQDWREVFSVVVEGGSGGKPGDGGRGGLPGKGGMGGLVWGSKTKRLDSGRRGNAGPLGTPGLSGSIGAQGQVIFRRVTNYSAYLVERYREHLIKWKDVIS